MFPRLSSLHVCAFALCRNTLIGPVKLKEEEQYLSYKYSGQRIIPKYCNSWMFIMRLFHHLWFFILWLNVDESLQQDEVNCSVPVIENGYVSGDIREYKRHEVLHFLCNETYSPFRKTPSICTKIGTKVVWDPTPKCERTTCRVSLLPPEGTRYEPPFRNLFSPGESVRVICGDKHNTSEVATCKDDGEWTFEPTCSAITCRLPHFPVGGATYDPPFRNVFPPGGRVKITCGDNYYISRPQDTSAVATCKDDGEWSFELTCREVTCNRPRDPTVYDWRNWDQRVMLRDTVRYSCRGGYKRTGGATEATCTRDGWRPNPLCQEINCNRRDFQHADVQNPQQIYRYGEHASYVCKDGYKGNFYLTCEENGWRGQQQCRAVTCKVKNYNSADIDGRVQSVYRYNDQVEYVCKDGFKGRFSITCGQNGWVGSPECTKVTCRRKDIPYADIEGKSRQVYTYSDRVHYNCKDGREGSFSLTCGQNGWEGSEDCREITCNRKYFQNADIEGTAKLVYKYNERVQYVCKNNHDGRFSLTCGQKDWEGSEDCRVHTECKKPDVQHGFMVGPYNETLYYTCEEGYKLVTKPWWGETKCGSKEALAQCIEESACGELPAIPHMEVESQRNNYMHGESVTINCKEGYVAQFVRLTCHEGKWNDSETSLEKICQPILSHCAPPPKVAHAVVVTSRQKEYTSGSKVTYQCRDHYTMEGVGRITCINGQWEEEKFTCSLAPNGNPCPNPPKVAHAVVDTSDQTEYTSGSKVTYQCRDQYTMEGVGRITCINGQWEEKKFICSPTLQQCERPDEIPNGYFEIVRGTHDFLFGAVIKYYCNEGYHMISKVDTRNCLLGSWSHDLPICAPSRCDPPPADEDITMKVLLKDVGSIYAVYVLTFSCDRPGKYLKGSPKLTCRRDGHWDNPFPSCEESCKVTGLPPNIRLSMHRVGDQLTEGQKLRFYCPLRGQTVRGRAEVECLANGQWSHPFPTCGAHFDCGRPPPLDNGDLKESQRNQYRNNERVEYVCQNYHIMDGYPFRTCNNGEWTGEMRCLKPCTVDSEAMNNRNIRFRFSYDNKKYSTHGDEMEFTCARGRPVRTGAMRQLCRDGVIDLPSCQ